MASGSTTAWQRADDAVHLRHHGVYPARHAGPAGIETRAEVRQARDVYSGGAQFGQQQAQGRTAIGFIADEHVGKLAGVATRATIDLAFDDEAAAKTVVEAEVSEGTIVASRTDQAFTDSACGGTVFQLYLESEGSLDFWPEIGERPVPERFRRIQMAELAGEITGQRNADSANTVRRYAGVFQQRVILCLQASNSADAVGSPSSMRHRATRAQDRSTRQSTALSVLIRMPAP